mmetsp:Transcript_46960/g.101997  ORF Transcript_46960/g.101997 Transcript_46960/m.101997 type:complete len:221 (-) Transcript_46960:314-976(-)
MLLVVRRGSSRSFSMRVGSSSESPTPSSSRASPCGARASGQPSTRRACADGASTTCLQFGSSSEGASTTALRRCRRFASCGHLSAAASRTTSRRPSPTATARCTTHCCCRAARRWKCRSAPARCTRTRRRDSPPTGSTRALPTHCRASCCATWLPLRCRRGPRSQARSSSPYSTHDWPNAPSRCVLYTLLTLGARYPPRHFCNNTPGRCTLSATSTLPHF